MMSAGAEGIAATTTRAMDEMPHATRWMAGRCMQSSTLSILQSQQEARHIDGEGASTFGVAPWSDYNELRRDAMK